MCTVRKKIKKNIKHRRKILCHLIGKQQDYSATGVAFGTAGIKVLSSKDAKRHTHTAQQHFVLKISL